jgi:hypothetical protein
VAPASDTTTSLDRFLEPAKAKLTVEQALVQWMVQTRQPFTTIEHPAFRAMFDAAGVALPVRSADTFRDRVKSAFQSWRHEIKQDLAHNCESLALSLDVWTSDHQLAVLAVIGHWIAPDFGRREALLEFAELRGAHSGENMAEVVHSLLQELEVAPKLLTITGDNASNNGTLCDTLYAELHKDYDDEDSAFRMQPLMRFHGRPSFIRCLAHVINLVCKEVLAHLGAGSAKEAKATLDESSLLKNPPLADHLSSKGAIVKIRLLVLWITRSSQRRQEWKRVSPTKQINYDVDNRWNSTYRMVADAIRLRKELTQFVRIQPEIRTLQPTEKEWSMLQQIEKILQPFWEFTHTVSKDCSTIADSLPIYWSLNDLLKGVPRAQDECEHIEPAVRVAVERATEKLNKFTRLVDENILYYVGLVLDPRIKTSLIEAQMSASDARLMVNRVRAFLHREYPAEVTLPPMVDRPEGMSGTLWKTLMRVQPHARPDVSDIDRYMDSPPVSWSRHPTEDGDPDWVLKWWRANAFDFPLMARAARDYLAVPSSEVGVERIFSGARDVLGLRRHAMNAETMRWLMLLNGQYDRE